MTESALIPTGCQMKSYACMRSLAQKGINTTLATRHDSIPQFASRYCDEAVTLSPASDDIRAYKNELVEVASREDIRTIFPTRESEAYLLAKYREEFEQHVSLVTPSLRTLRKAQDRLQLAEAADDAGVPIPETRLLSDVERWNSEYIVKSRFNLLTGDYLEPHPEAETEEVNAICHIEAGERPDFDGLRATMNHEPIVQEFVPKDQKYMFCALYDHGTPLATYQHDEIRGNSWVGGGGVYRKSAHAPGLEAVGVALLDHLQWHGLACLEYIRDADTGEWKLLEINPKLWQSLPSTVRANADFPYYYWLQATGRPEEIDPEYDLDVGCHMLYGELRYLLSIFRDDSPLIERPSVGTTVRDIVRSCLRQSQFDYLRGDDPQLFLSSLRHVFASGMAEIAYDTEQHVFASENDDVLDDTEQHVFASENDDVLDDTEQHVFASENDEMLDDSELSG